MLDDDLLIGDFFIFNLDNTDFLKSQCGDEQMIFPFGKELASVKFDAAYSDGWSPMDDGIDHALHGGERGDGRAVVVPECS